MRVIFLLIISNSCIAIEYDFYLSPESYDYNEQYVEPVLVSLGFNCIVATQFVLNEVRQFAFPFDWIRTPFDALCQLIQNDFKDFLSPNFLKPSEVNAVINSYFGTQFFHDFPKDSNDMLCQNYLEALPSISEKYDRRIERFKKLLNSKTKVYLIRHRVMYAEKPLDKLNVSRLRDILFQKFPQGNWTLVVIDNGNEFKQDWKMNKVINIHLAAWNDNTAWTNIFSSLGAIKSLKRQSYGKANSWNQCNISSLKWYSCIR